MESVIFRFSIVWLVLHIILFFIERYRYKHSNWSWYGFKNGGMLEITYIVWAIDRVGCCLAVVGGLLYWIFQPVMN
jgi:hypothetical protein